MSPRHPSRRDCLMVASAIFSLPSLPSGPSPLLVAYRRLAAAADAVVEAFGRGRSPSDEEGERVLAEHCSANAELVDLIVAAAGSDEKVDENRAERHFEPVAVHREAGLLYLLVTFEVGQGATWVRPIVIPA